MDSIAAPRTIESERRSLFVEATLDMLAETGIAGTTLGRVAERAGTSAGLIVHYFGDKDALLAASFRTLVARLRAEILSRLARADSPRARVQAVIDATLAPHQFQPRHAAIWLALWGQVAHAPTLRRIQTAYQQRLLSNLRHDLAALMPRDEAGRAASTLAALIDGVWLQAALSGWSSTRAEDARRLVGTVLASVVAAGRAPTAGPATPPLAVPHLLPEGSARLRRNWIGGRVVDSRERTFETINPATGEVLAEIQSAGPDELAQAVAAARPAQRAWAATTGAERARILRRAAELLRARNAALARLETLDTGKPIQETEAVDILSGADCLEYFAAIAATLTGEQVDLGPGAFGYTRREPLGLVAGIGAWNYPMQIACWKAAPALACGNAMIFKPSELTPLSALALAGIFQEAGLPDGLFSVLQGDARLGQMLSRSPDIAKISLTGAVGTGRKIMADGAATLKQVTLELGGKSPLIVFDDAHLDNAVSAAMLGNFYSSGQVCSNGTRVFVHERILPDFLERLAARTARLRIGDPLDPDTQIGALISTAHMERVLSYIETGRREGATLLAGGHRVTDGPLARGSFVAPTIFTDCRDTMTIVQDEIFGPVMSVLSFTDEDEVVARANATAFGLAAGVFTRDLARAHRMIAALEAGTCWINQYNVTPIELPFGGIKQSGLGRENGHAAVAHYTQIKSVYVALTDIDSPY